MKKTNVFKMLFATVFASTLLLSGCKEEEITEVPTNVISGTLTGNITWTKDKVYKLQGFVRVGEDLTPTGTPTKTGTLTIEPGTVIIGDRASKGTLIIQRGSKLIAEGTAANPIVFTSERGIGLRAPGDWGGLVLCGNATNNFPGGVAELEGGYGAYHGGTNDADNSGSLKYVRIEFAGIAINPNQEVNSLTMGSVGSGTTIENVQCSFGGDDAFEWFGGTVNCKNLIAYRCQDDDFDMDNGFRGKIQFAIGIKDPNIADQSGSNGFEIDNDGTGSINTPFTAPTLSNITIVGPKADRNTSINIQFSYAAHLRRNNKIKIHNSFFVGYPNGIYIDGSNTQVNATAGDLVVKNSTLAAVENWGGNGFGSKGTLYVNATVGTDTLTNQHPNNPRGIPYLAAAGVGINGSFVTKDWFNTSGFGNAFADKYQDVGFTTSLFDFATLNILPTAASSILSGADFTGLTAPFTTVTYKGAFGATNWTTGWAEWNPSAKVY